MQPWCAWPGGCGYPIDEDNPLTGDHDLALSRGGQTSPNNLVVLCKRHNSEKGTRTLDEVMTTRGHDQ